MSDIRQAVKMKGIWIRGMMQSQDKKEGIKTEKPKKLLKGGENLRSRTVLLIDTSKPLLKKKKKSNDKAQRPALLANLFELPITARPLIKISAFAKD